MEEKYRRSLLDSVIDVVRDNKRIIFHSFIKKSPSPLVNQQGLAEMEITGLYQPT